MSPRRFARAPVGLGGTDADFELTGGGGGGTTFFFFEGLVRYELRCFFSDLC